MIHYERLVCYMGFFSFLKRWFTSSQTSSRENKKSGRSKPKSTSVTSNQEIHPIYLKPLPNGLLPGEVVLLDWLDGKVMDGHFSGYFSYTYGLDPKKSAVKLQREGLMIEADPVESLATFKVV